MKNLVLFALVLTAAACGGKKEAPAQPEVKTTLISEVLDAYLDVKDALVTSNPENVTKVESLFVEAINNVAPDSSDAAAIAQWAPLDSALSARAAEMVAATDIEAKRAAFSAVSEELYIAVKVYGNDGRPLFRQHCPMALNDTGANWLSRQELISNPYFGDRMLRCGSTTETL